MVVNYKRQEDRSQRHNPLKETPTTIVIDVLLNLAKDSSGNNLKPCPPGEQGVVEIVPVLHTLVTRISSIRLKSPSDLRSTDSKKNILKTIEVSCFNGYIRKNLIFFLFQILLYNFRK